MISEKWIAVGAHLFSAMEGKIRIAVVIPTWRRSEELARLLIADTAGEMARRKSHCTAL